MEVIQGQLTVASGFWTAHFSKEVWRKVSWSLEMVLLRSIFIILSSKPRFLYKVQASRGFLFSPNTFILFRFQTAASSCCCQILDTCQMKEMLCGVSCWFLVHRGWRGMHWQKGAGMGSSAAGGGQQRRKKDKGDSDPQLPMSRVRETIADSCTVSRSETAQMSVWGLHDPRTHMSPPFHQHGPTLEQRFQYLEKWKHTLNRNRASSGLNLRASAAAIWEPLRREEVLPHKKLQL